MIKLSSSRRTTTESLKKGPVVPLFSFIVIAYNVSAYIETCLDSLKKQKGAEYEIIVVNDASTDDTLDTIYRCAADDSRFHVINKKTNGGAHLARRDGVLSSSGRFIVFVDGDDELSPSFCELMGPYVVTHHSDITRFGRRVISTRFENDAAAASNEAMFNVALPCTMEDGSILPCIFSDECVPRLTWSIIDVVLQGDFARLCFQKMTSDHLGRMQDSYEMFVLCACARRFETITDFQGLHYNFGNGCSGNTEETAQQFVAMQLSAKQLNNHIAEFADSTDSVVIKQCAQWLEEEYVRIIGNDWVIRLNAENQQATILNVVETWGIDTAYRILSDTLDARAKWFVAQKQIPEQTDDFYRWLGMLTTLENEYVQSLGLAEERSRIHEYGRQFHDEKVRRELEAKLEKEREELEKESQRRFKKGTFMRKLSDACLPENSLRRDLANVIVAHRRK